MWDMPVNKGPSLRQQAGWGDLFQWPQIALCSLNWQTWAGWDRNDMQLPLARPTQVDHISAGKQSLILYSACESSTLANHAFLGTHRQQDREKLIWYCASGHLIQFTVKSEPQFIYGASIFQLIICNYIFVQKNTVKMLSNDAKHIIHEQYLAIPTINSSYMCKI